MKAIFFFISSFGNHKAKILLGDSFSGCPVSKLRGEMDQRVATENSKSTGKRRAECTLEAPGIQPKARASVSHGLVLMSKPAGSGSLRMGGND